jgi:hypothetical protein
MLKSASKVLYERLNFFAYASLLPSLVLPRALVFLFTGKMRAVCMAQN